MTNQEFGNRDNIGSPCTHIGTDTNTRNCFVEYIDLVINATTKSQPSFKTHSPKSSGSNPAPQLRAWSFELCLKGGWFTTTATDHVYTISPLMRMLKRVLFIIRYFLLQTVVRFSPNAAFIHWSRISHWFNPTVVSSVLSILQHLDHLLVSDGYFYHFWGFVVRKSIQKIDSLPFPATHR